MPSGVEASHHYLNHSVLKSSNWGFTFLIKTIFLSRRHFFNCFSRSIAACTSSVSSKYSNLRRLYFLLNPSTNPCLCSYILLPKSLVTPIYRVVFHLLVMI